VSSINLFSILFDRSLAFGRARADLHWHARHLCVMPAKPGLVRRLAAAGRASKYRVRAAGSKKPASTPFNQFQTDAKAQELRNSVHRFVR
jgi:hypothetical protein